MALCEICGQPATVFVADLRELEATEPDAKGWRWRQWEAVATHCFCEAHRRPPEVAYLPATTERERAEMRQMARDCELIGSLTARGKTWATNGG